MTINSFRADAPANAQVLHLIPSNVGLGDQFTARINGKGYTYTAEAATVADVVAGLTALLASNPLGIAEWDEVVATEGSGYVILTAATPGRPVIVTTSTTNAEGGSSALIVETIKGVSPVNEQQTIRLDAAYSGGTFVLTNDFGSGTESTGNIAYNATGAAVKTAIVAGMASVTTADLDVAGPAGGPWLVTWKGSFAAVEVPEFTVDGALLTGANVVDVDTLQQGYSGADTVYLLSTAMLSDQAGTYRLNVGGVWTGNIAIAATAATVKTALEALPTVEVGDVEVTGFVSAHAQSPGHVLCVRFTGNYKGINVTMTADWLNAVRDGVVEKLIVGGAASWPEIQIWDYGGTTGNPSGDTWRFSHEETTDTSSVFGQLFTAGGVATSWGDQVQDAASYVAFDIQELGSLYGLDYDTDLEIRHFVAGNGFVAVFSGPAATAIDQPLGQIATTGVSSSLARAASVTTVIDGGAGSANEQWSIKVSGSGGTFTLSDGTDTTSAIAYGASAATIKTRLEADLAAITTVTVTGTGTFLAPYIVTVTSPAGTNLPELIGDGTSLTGGSGSCVETTAHNAGTNERQTLTLDAATTGGTFAVTFRGQTTGPIAYDAAAATLETALEGLSTIGAGNVAVAGSAGGPWTIDFENTLGLQDVELLTIDDSLLEGGVGNQNLTVVQSVRSTGPNHFDDPLNWTLGRVPETTDEIALEKCTVDMLYGLDQVREFTADASEDTLTIPWHSFVQGQKVRLKTSAADLPDGLAVATDYYVVYVDHDTIQLSATRNGSAIDLLDAGTGTHRIGIQLASYEQLALYSGEIGLPRYDHEGGYFEYRPRFLKVWTDAAASVTIGEGDGPGSSRINVDFDDSEVRGKIYSTGGSLETGVSACLLRNVHADSTWLQLDGDVGLAFDIGETAQFDTYTQRGGDLRLGRGSVVGNIDKTGGSILSMGATVAGTIRGNF